jgi:hypothetical protein
MNGRQLARGLAWFSVGLGLVELMAPRRLTARLGLKRRAGLVRGLGLREMGEGVAILLNDGRSSSLLWGRVAGDLLDLALLETARPRSRRQRRNLAAARAAVIGATAIDVLCAERLRNEAGGRGRRTARDEEFGTESENVGTYTDDVIVIPKPSSITALR